MRAQRSTHRDQEPFCMDIYRKNAGPQFRGARFVASLRSRNAHGHFTRAILCSDLQEKCRTPISGHLFCARLRNRNAHGHFTICVEIYRENDAHYSAHLN